MTSHRRSGRSPNTMCTPLDLARRIYDREWCSGTFPQHLVLHLTHGWVISTPQFFMMGRPVLHTAPESLILDIAHKFDDPDAWLVWAAAGTHPRELIRHMPFPLPHIGWQKRNRLRWYALGDLGTRLSPQGRGCTVGGLSDDQQPRACRCGRTSACAAASVLTVIDPSAPASCGCGTIRQYAESHGPWLAAHRPDVHDPRAAGNS